MISGAFLSLVDTKKVFMNPVQGSSPGGSRPIAEPSRVSTWFYRAIVWVKSLFRSENAKVETLRSYVLGHPFDRDWGMGQILSIQRRLLQAVHIGVEGNTLEKVQTVAQELLGAMGSLSKPLQIVYGTTIAEQIAHAIPEPRTIHDEEKLMTLVQSEVVRVREHFGNSVVAIFAQVAEVLVPKIPQEMAILKSGVILLKNDSEGSKEEITRVYQECCEKYFEALGAGVESYSVEGFQPVASGAREYLQRLYDELCDNFGEDWANQARDGVFRSVFPEIEGIFVSPNPLIHPTQNLAESFQEVLVPLVNLQTLATIFSTENFRPSLQTASLAIRDNRDVQGRLDSLLKVIGSSGESLEPGGFEVVSNISKVIAQCPPEAQVVLFVLLRNRLGRLPKELCAEDGAHFSQLPRIAQYVLEHSYIQATPESIQEVLRAVQP